MLAALEGLDEALAGVHYLHAARGDAFARLGREPEARQAFERARELARNETERLHVVGRLAALDE
jgi:RNA polymerase sigma-70 factor (ECF subfamily)